MAGPLDGVKVLDLTRVLAGPYATMVMSDLGAEVIKVEHPEGGDMARGTGPFVDGQSSYFMSINRGKKSVILDLKDEVDKQTFLELLDHFDVLVENFVPGVMKRLGLDYEVLSKRHPRLIYAAVSGFGQWGPYTKRPALDIIVQAMGGIMSITGEPGRPPVRPGSSLGDITAGLFTTIGILSALHERDRSGVGQMIDVAMLDCQMAVLENAFARYFTTGEVPTPLGTRHPVTTPFQVYATSDGYVALAFVGGAKDQWPIFCALLDRVDLIDDERFTTSWNRTLNYDVLNPIIEDGMRRKSTAQWLQELTEAQIPCGPVNNIADVVADEHTKARGMIIDVPHPESGTVKMVNNPIRFSRTQAHVTGAAPLHGGDTEEVLGKFLGSSAPKVD